MLMTNMLRNDDESNPFKAPSEPPSEQPSERSRWLPLRLIPAVICGVIGLLALVVTIKVGFDVVSLTDKYGWEPVVSHPLTRGLGFLGAASVAWLISSEAWLHSRWRVALLGTILALGLQYGVNVISESYRRQESVEAAVGFPSQELTSPSIPPPEPTRRPS